MIYRKHRNYFINRDRVFHLLFRIGIKALPVFDVKVWIKNFWQNKGEKMFSILNIFFQNFSYLLSLSICSVGAWGEGRWYHGRACVTIFLKKPFLIFFLNFARFIYWLRIEIDCDIWSDFCSSQTNSINNIIFFGYWNESKFLKMHLFYKKIN